MSKTEIPSIRFRGFDDDWEQRKLGDIIIEYKETVDSDCTLPILTSSKTEGVILQEEHFGRKQQHDITGYNILPRNYCTYRNRSDGVDFTFNINKCCDKGIISKFYPVFSGKNCDVFFLSLVLNNIDEVVREIAYTCTGTGQKVLSFWDLQQMKVRAPSFDEQKEIAAYFEDLDHLITLHQRKFEKLTNVKKSMLEKMFPRNGSCYPEIRFKGFTDPWEQRKFSEITFLSGEKNRENLPLESYSITNESGFVPQDEKFENGGTMREANKRMYYIVSPNSFAYNPARINVGSIGYQNTGKNVIVSSLYEIFKTSDDVDDRLLWHWFKSPDFQKLIWQLQEGGVRLYFYYDKLCMGEVSLPSLEEQRKIGKFFDTLDNLITLHQRKPFLMKWRTSDANRNQTNRLVL